MTGKCIERLIKLLARVATYARTILLVHRVWPEIYSGGLAVLIAIRQ